jgi:hypothetical protein
VQQLGGIELKQQWVGSVNGIIVVVVIVVGKREDLQRRVHVVRGRQRL